MGRAFRTVCTKVGCFAVAVRGASRCERHPRDPEEHARIRALRRSGPTSSAKAGYDATWRRVRLAHLLAHPFCEFCAKRGLATPATEVDHVASVRERPDLRLDQSNLRALCKPCHSRHTAKTTRFGRGSREKTVPGAGGRK